MAVKTFTTGEVLTASDTNTYLNNGGLVYINSVAVPASPASSSVVVTNCFSSTYDSYRIIISGLVANNDSYSMYCKLNNSSGATYWYGANYQSFTGPANGQSFSGTGSSNGLTIGFTSGNATYSSFDLHSPYKTTYTFANFNNASNGYMFMGTSVDKNAVSHTGFTFQSDSGVTFTNGAVAVYGYRKA